MIADLQHKLEAAESLQLMEAGEIAGYVGILKCITNTRAHTHTHTHSLSLSPSRGYRFSDDDDEGVGQLPPPRLFCDICDQFDLHDTDDCPMQAASDSPPPSSYGDTRAPGGSDRPYCNNCEGQCVCVCVCVCVLLTGFNHSL